MSVDPTIQTEVLTYLTQLGADDQAKVVNLARSLVSSSKRGTPGKELLRIIGSIPHDDLEQMKQVIEQDCERVDSNGW